jgi:hypothetical protein
MQTGTKYTIIIPAVESEILNRCLASIDIAVRENVIVYANGPDITLDHDVLERVGVGLNDGISTAWNYGRERVLENGQDYLLICSQNNVFADGMRDFINRLDEQRPKYGVWSNLGWHLMALSRETLERCGKFDTNLYPAYYEDNEYAIRLHKLGMIDTFYEIRVKGEVKPGFSSTLGIKVDDEPLKQYVKRKWGDTFNWMSYHEQTFFEHPFDSSENDIGYFEVKTRDQLIDEYGYRNKIKDLYVNNVKDKI